jgi:hypothetical protein
MTVLAAVMGGAGCAERERSPDPEPRSRINERPVRVPVREYEEEKPLPEQARGGQVPPPPYDDVPLVNQRPPEQRAFVQAYEGVGRPRIIVFVNRTLEGEIVPVNPEDPYVSVERNRTTRGDVRIESRDTRRRDDFYRGRDDRDREDRFESRGPAEVRDRVDVYLRRGDYDEADARALDYEAMENVLTDWLAADGRVEIISPVMARQRLTDEQVKELQEGRPRMLGEIAKQLDADVLVQVQTRPTRHTVNGLEFRVIAEAINVSRGGQSIARAFVDVPPPLDKPQLNKYTRFLARKLMDGMTGSWHAMAEGGDRGGPETRDAERGTQRRSDGPVLDDRTEPRRDSEPPRDADRDRPGSRDLVPSTRTSPPPATQGDVSRPGVPPAGER